MKKIYSLEIIPNFESQIISMIREHIKKHDQQTFEVKLEFPSSQHKEKDLFFVDMYLFLPYALDINKHHYSKQDFYKSLKTHIRLTTPFSHLKNTIIGKNSPYTRLSKSVNSFIASPDEGGKSKTIFQIKRFSSIFGTSLRHASNHIKNTQNSIDRDYLIAEFVNDVLMIREEYKGLRKTLDVPMKNGNVSDIYQFADEYQSLLVEKHVYILTEDLTRKNVEKGNTQLIKLNDLVLDEMKYRQDKGYLSVAKTHRSNADVLHRASRLKKFIESNLFLNTDTKRDGVVFEQLMFSLAAGLAMVFATAVAFASQLIFETLTLPFFIVLVVSYMFKDRIKEIVRLYLNKKHQRYYYDYTTKIYNHKERKIGSLKESFEFIKHKHLPLSILNSRNKMRSTEISNESMGEKIILYRNKIKLINKNADIQDDSAGFTEILRLNISDFTKKMDDPEKEIYIKTRNGFKRSFANRVYHLNMILSYSNGNKSQSRLYKLIVHKNGIDRIEHIHLY